MKGHVVQGASNPLAQQGLAPAQGRESEGVYQNRHGQLFKLVAGKVMQWSNAKNTWMPR